MKKIKKSLLIISLVGAGLALFSCQKKGFDSNVSFASNYDSEGSVNAPTASKKMMARSMASNDMVLEEAVPEMASSISGESGTVSTERKLIKNGNITLQVEDLLDGEKSVTEWAKGFNGYVENSSTNERNAWFTVKVPSQKFDEAMQSLGNLGIVKSHGISMQDVSEQYYDLETRLSTKKVMQANLKKYLAQATNLNDILKIERELNNVTSEVESMEGRMRRLTNQIDYATISVTLTLPNGKTAPVIHKPGIAEGLKEFFSRVGSFFVIVFKVIAYAILCGIPLLAVISLLFWLLFGKVGLIKKLFKKLK